MQLISDVLIDTCELHLYYRVGNTSSLYQKLVPLCLQDEMTSVYMKNVTVIYKGHLIIPSYDLCVAHYISFCNSIRYVYLLMPFLF